MNTPLTRMLGAVLAIVAAVVVWNRVFVSDESRIRAALADTAAALSGANSDPLGQVAALGRLRERLTEDVVVSTGVSGGEIRGRDAVAGAWRRRRASADELTLRVLDVEVEVAPDGATADADLVVQATISRGGQPDEVDAREVRVALVKRDGTWLVARVTLIDAVAPVD
jgi:ketosteroid isomerase-like protein